MRRALLVICCLAAGFPPAAGASPAATVRLAGCVAAPEADARSATFEARARGIRDSVRIQVRFTLQLRDEAPGGWRRVVAHGLDEWLGSEPGVRRYSFARTVQNLSAPASYRMVVRFRWLDAAGDVLKGARATSATCRQPDVRPDLVPAALVAAPGAEAGTSRYLVTVRNTGRAPAEAFSVGLGLGDRELAPLAVAGLAAGEARVITFVGPSCRAGVPLSVAVDPEDVVQERDEQDNELFAACPG